MLEAQHEVMTEIILYGGKGGVGKTTVAVGTAVELARNDYETLIVSTDPAHSLSDATEMDLGGEPTEIRHNLWGVEIDPQTGVDRYRSLFELLADDLADAGIRLDEEEVASLFTSGIMPGSDELAALDGLTRYLGSDRWDRIVFDTAPTGHTLRLLDLPTVMDEGAAAALDLRDQVRRKVDTARTMMFGPMARRRREDSNEFTELREQMTLLREVLRDPEKTEFRVVTIPEPMVVQETERLVAQLRKFEIPVSCLVVNRVIDDPGDCHRCQARQTIQEDALERLRTALPTLEVWTVPDRPGELAGLDALAEIGALIQTTEPTLESGEA
jgi:arsenite-transporting ATPase